MNYRLLNEGEVIQEGDEVWYCNSKWEPSLCPGKTIEEARPQEPRLYRRPIANEWIPIAERKPVPEDGTIILRNIYPRESDRRFELSLGNYNSVYEHDCKKTTHWIRMPDFPQEPDPFGEAWRKWKTDYDRSGEVIRVTDEQARHFFEAGRDYEKNKR